MIQFKDILFLTVIGLTALSTQAQQDSITSNMTGADSLVLAIVEDIVDTKIYYNMFFDEVSPTSKKAIFNAEFKKSAEGVIEVTTFRKKTGKVVMTGQQEIDATARLHGNFNFYHPNGKLESSGRMEQGIKVGAWKRYSKKGKSKADRYYTKARKKKLLKYT